MRTQNDGIEPFPQDIAEWARVGFTWVDGRWHLHGKAIHAGTSARLHNDRDESDPPGPQWIQGRIETRESGRRMFFCKRIGGHDFRREILAFHKVELVVT